MLLVRNLLPVYLNKQSIFSMPCNLKKLVTHNIKTYLNRNCSTKTIKVKLNMYDAEIKNLFWPSALRCSYMWLRDHCRCLKCYNVSTNQRKLDLLSIVSEIHPINCTVDDESLKISWSDGHFSSYNVDWLWNNNYQGHFHHVRQSTKTPVLWDGVEAGKIDVAHVTMETFMNSDVGLCSIVDSILKFGVAFVTNVCPTLKATETVAVRLAEIQCTLFGNMWEFSDEMVHSDTAYSKQALDAHTDGTYLTEPPGQQVFHCLHHDGTGGQTLLVDGFRAATELKSCHPEVYDRLCKTYLEAQYIEDGKHYAATYTVLRCHPVSGSLEQVRFNLYDRAPMYTVPEGEVQQTYSDLQDLARVIRHPGGEWWFKLEPGTVVFIDNWRVLHGRASYTGTRRMAGCYLSRDNFLSTARQLQLV